jgi:hypothetical protein
MVYVREIVSNFMIDNSRSCNANNFRVAFTKKIKHIIVVVDDVDVDNVVDDDVVGNDDVVVVVVDDDVVVVVVDDDVVGNLETNNQLVLYLKEYKLSICGKQSM